MGADEPKKWFANKGQIIQATVATVACMFAGIKAWPELKDSHLLSLGAIVFYLLVGLVFFSIVYTGIQVRRARATAPDPPQEFPDLDTAQFADTKRQFYALSRFEVFAVWQLLLKDGMAEEHFSDLVREHGFPMATQADLTLLRGTFSAINGKVTFLARDLSGIWSVKTAFKPPLHFLISRSSPIFGI